MTIEMSGLVAAQGRVAQLQARMGLTPGPAASTLTSNTTSFDSSMRSALGTSRGASAGARATAAAPFVFDPTVGPADVKTKPGAAQALATPVISRTPGAASDSAATAASAASVSSASVTRAAGGATSAHATSGTGAAAATPTSATAATSGTAATTVRAVSGPSAVAGASRVDDVVATAKKYLGVPYLWGGTNPAKGLDCSGFTQLVFKQNGVTLPRVARAQQKEGERVPSLAQARPGDLITFGNPATHIGIYLGNNTFIHAPRTGDVVKISEVYRKPSSIRRVLPDSAWQDAPAAATTRAAASNAARPAASTPAAVAAAATPATTVATAAVRAATTSAALSAAARAAAAGIAPAGGSTGGWTGAPVADTWGAASAEAASRGVNAIVAGAPGSAAGAPNAPTAAAAAMSSAAVTAAVTAAGASAGSASGVLGQAPAKYRSLFTSAAEKYGVSADLLAAVAKQESDFTPTAVSHAGARGLMQLMPGTARGLGVRDSFDPAQAVDGAARLLRDHLKTFQGSTELALAAYNAGPGAVRRYGGVPPYAETQNYVRKIMTNLRAGAA